jgi:hypothetical protein
MRASRDLERIEVIVNVASASVTSIVAALKCWRFERVVAAAGTMVASGDAATALRHHVEAKEMTGLLLAGRNLLSY